MYAKYRYCTLDNLIYKLKYLYISVSAFAFFKAQVGMCFMMTFIIRDLSNFSLQNLRKLCPLLLQLKNMNGFKVQKAK